MCYAARVVYVCSEKSPFTKNLDPLKFCAMQYWCQTVVQNNYFGHSDNWGNYGNSTIICGDCMSSAVCIKIQCSSTVCVCVCVQWSPYKPVQINPWFTELYKIRSIKQMLINCFHKVMCQPQWIQKPGIVSALLLFVLIFLAIIQQRRGPKCGLTMLNHTYQNPELWIHTKLL